MDFVEFGFTSWRKAPDAYGIYCWRYKPIISKGQLKQIMSEIDLAHDDTQRGQILYSRLEDLLIYPFSRPAYDVSMFGNLLPEYSGFVEHKLPDMSMKFQNMAADSTSLPELVNYLNDLYKLVSTPFYVGIAGRQTLKLRIKNHVQTIERYKRDRRFLDDDDEECKNLAARIVERKINLSCLWISCLPVPPACRLDISDLEYILNRTINPILGRN